MIKQNAWILLCEALGTGFLWTTNKVAALSGFQKYEIDNGYLVDTIIWVGYINYQLQIFPRMNCSNSDYHLQLWLWQSLYPRGIQRTDWKYEVHVKYYTVHMQYNFWKIVTDSGPWALAPLGAIPPIPSSYSPLFFCFLKVVIDACTTKSTWIRNVRHSIFYKKCTMLEFQPGTIPSTDEEHTSSLAKRVHQSFCKRRSTTWMYWQWFSSYCLFLYWCAVALLCAARSIF